MNCFDFLLADCPLGFVGSFFFYWFIGMPYIFKEISLLFVIHVLDSSSGLPLCFVFVYGVFFPMQEIFILM